MQPVESVKFLGLLSILLSWAGLAILVKKWPKDNSLTFSLHAAKNRHAYLMMALVESVVIPMFYIFTVFWFVPSLKLPFLFTFCITVSSIGLLVAAWVPETGGLKQKIHFVSAFIAANFFIPALLLISLSASVPTAARIISALSIIYMIAVNFIYASKKLKDKTLLMQAIFIASFHVSILAATYLT